MVAISHMWPLSTWNMASTTVELNFYFIISHMWLVATTMNSAALEIPLGYTVF